MMQGLRLTRALALRAVVGLALAQAPTAAAQAPPRMSQVIRVYDATLSYPVPLWVKSQADLDSSSIYPQQNKNVFVQEQIRKTQTLANWTEMLKIVGNQTADAHKIGVRGAIEGSISSYRAACEKDKVALRIYRQDAATALFAVLCGNTPNGPRNIGYGDGVGEISVTRIFIVKNTIVQLLYSWRGAKFDIAKPATYPVPTTTITRVLSLLETAEAR